VNLIFKKYIRCSLGICGEPVIFRSESIIVMLKWLIGIIVEPCAFKIKAKLFVIFIFVVKMSYD